MRKTGWHLKAGFVFLAGNGRRNGAVLGQESSFGKWQADGGPSCSLKASKKSVNLPLGLGNLEQERFLGPSYIKFSLFSIMIFICISLSNFYSCPSHKRGNLGW